jgi:hypothetical protein
MLRWPLRSPDLTPVYFLLWGHVKEPAHGARSTEIEDLLARFHDAVAAVDAGISRRAYENITRRTAVCNEVHGASSGQLSCG